MATPTTSAAPDAQMSTTTIIAIITAVGVVILCLLSVLTWLLVRAIRRHKQLLADLDERGMSLAQAQKGANQKPVARPRAVLRRNTMLPFNAKSGWGTLPSMETIGSAEPGAAKSHYVPPKPTEATKEKSRLSWPFHARKTSSHLMEMKAMKGNRLSTVLEDPKPSSMVPVLNSDQLSKARPPLSVLKECGSRPSSSQSLLQYHPAFRNERPSSAEAARSRQRSRSVTELTLCQNERPQLRARSTSLCSQLSGKAPDVILPPLPLDIARVKDEARTRHELRQVPSLLSMSSIGSANSSILNPRPSPIIMQSSNKRSSKITKRNWTNSAFSQVKPMKEVRQSVSGAQGWTASTARLSTDSTRPLRYVGGKTTPPIDSSTQTIGSENGLHYTDAVRTWATPKRSSRPYVAGGSPERYLQGASSLRNRGGSIRSPKRQPSQASSRSSCGNPFQWDPAPFSSTGKPSALKGSPGARQGHKRKTSVRISLVPTVHPIQSRVASLVSGEDKENAREGVAASKPSVGPASTPSSSTFEPDLGSATSLRATLMSNSPELPSIPYDPPFTIFPDQKRSSTGSVLSLSRFPVPSSSTDSDDETHPPSLSSKPTLDFDLKLAMPETPLLVQYPFRDGTPDRRSTPSPTIDIDECDSERPALGFQTPSNNSTRIFQSAFATIPEESSVSSQRTLDFDHSRYDDSPPVSPKTTSPPRFTMQGQSTYDQTVPQKPIPEEPVATINPALIMKDTFSILNSSVDLSFSVQTSNPPSNTMPSNPFDMPIPPSPTAPCSPRPAHASLPTPTPTSPFTDIPCLAPPTRSPPKPAPLRSSIQQLRRMNSDALDARKDRSGRGERRYLRLGRPESTQFNESWVDDATDNEGETDAVTGATASSDDDTTKAQKKPNTHSDEGELTPRAKRTRTTIAPQHHTAPTFHARLTADASPGATFADRTSRTSSLWDESDAFWASPTPTHTSPTIHAPSPSNPAYKYALADIEARVDFDTDDDDAPPSPILDGTAFPGFPSPSTSYAASAHQSREFDFVGDGLVTPTGSPRRRSGRRGVRRSRRGSKMEGGKEGQGKDGVRIQVTSPRGTMVGLGWYDDDGFLR